LGAASRFAVKYDTNIRSAPPTSKSVMTCITVTGLLSTVIVAGKGKFSATVTFVVIEQHPSLTADYIPRPEIICEQFTELWILNRTRNS
jgi:hypothetical protein